MLYRGKSFFGILKNGRGFAINLFYSVNLARILLIPVLLKSETR